LLKETYDEIEAFSSCYCLENLGGDCTSHHIKFRGILIRVAPMMAIPGPPAQKSSQLISRKYIPLIVPATIENLD
jgi:hypothetical protein